MQLRSASKARRSVSGGLTPPRSTPARTTRSTAKAEAETLAAPAKAKAAPRAIAAASSLSTAVAAMEINVAKLSCVILGFLYLLVGACAVLSPASALVDRLGFKSAPAPATHLCAVLGGLQLGLAAALFFAATQSPEARKTALLAPFFEVLAVTLAAVKYPPYGGVAPSLLEALLALPCWPAAAAAGLVKAD